MIVESPVNTIETNIYGTELVLQYANLKRKKSDDRFNLGSVWEKYEKTILEEDDLVLGATTKGVGVRVFKAIDEFWPWRIGENENCRLLLFAFLIRLMRQTGRYGMVSAAFLRARRSKMNR